MKATNLTTTVKRTSIVLLTVLFLATTAGAQNVKAESSIANKAAVENLIAGIKSDNNGLKRDCIYFAAIYGVQEAVDVLSKELKNEKNLSNRVLIALALYKLGAGTGEEDLSKYVSIDWDARASDIASEASSRYIKKLSVTGNKK